MLKYNVSMRNEEISLIEEIGDKVLKMAKANEIPWPDELWSLGKRLREFAWNKRMETTMLKQKHVSVTHQAVASRAYELWEHDGKPEGNDLFYWLKAEAELSIPVALRKKPFKKPTLKKPSPTPLKVVNGG